MSISLKGAVSQKLVDAFTKICKGHATNKQLVEVKFLE